jgi:hypothetical protein
MNEWVWSIDEIMHSVKNEVLGEKPAPIPLFFHHKSHTKGTGIENAPLWWKRMANPLINDTSS